MADAPPRTQAAAQRSGSLAAAALAAGVVSVVGIRELSKRTSELVREVEETGEPVVITRHGRPAATVIPMSAEQLADYVLANAPEFLRAIEEADRSAEQGQLTTLADLRRELGDDGSARSSRGVSDAASRAPARAKDRTATTAARGTSRSA